ncbi:secretin N-terminal domain-containing protein [Planctomycetota bacterium]
MHPMPMNHRSLILLCGAIVFLTPVYGQDPNAPAADVNEPITQETQTSPAEETSPPSTETTEEVYDPNAPVSLKLNFQDVPLQVVLNYLSEKTGLVIVSDESLDARMTVISRQPICLDEAIALINSVLMEQALTAVRMDRTLKIATLDKAPTMNIPVSSGSEPDDIVAGDSMVTHIIPVRYADVVKLKENLASLLPTYAILEANLDGNALILTDTTAGIKRVMKIIKALDTHMSKVAEIKVIRLTNADATTTAELINKVFAEDTTAQSSGGRSSGGRGSGGRSSGGRGSSGGPMEMMMRMRSAAAAGNNNAGAASGSKATGAVTAVGDERTNAIVIRGPEEALNLAMEVIETLDTSSTETIDVKVVQLKYADADNVAELVNQVFGKDRETAQTNQRGGGGGGRGGPSFRGPQADTSSDQSSLSEVIAASDDRTNSVVITGPKDMLGVIGKVIVDLDSPNADLADVEVFHLNYADAQNTADLINEVFGEDRNTSSRNNTNATTSFQRGGGGGRGGGAAQQATSTATSAASVVASADERTNSIVVSGPSDTLEVISGIIKDLDANPEQERKMFVYKLKNGEAANVMEVLNNLFDQLQNMNSQGTSSTQRFQGGGGGRGGGGGAATTASSGSSSTSSNSDLDEDAFFEADESTNSLLILTSSKNYEKIKPIIDELDEPLKQVLIKVLFAEITHSDSIDLGTEFSVTNIGSVGTISQDFGLSSPTANEGVKFNFLDDNLDITLRALQETGNLNVLSRPYILTSDNHTASFNVVKEVPIPDSSSLSDGGTLNTSVIYKDVGIKLDVTPSINPEGLVIMDVSPEISELTGETVQINEELSSEIFATRSTSARVAVKDGQTIVIGGLIEDSIKKIHKKVPLLGDIPLLGALFRRTIDSTAKIELLIFVTPFVADDEAELAAISTEQQALSTIPLDDVKDDPAYRRYIRTLPETTPEK